jgi:hypothetical protein
LVQGHFFQQVVVFGRARRLCSGGHAGAQLMERHYGF